MPHVIIVGAGCFGVSTAVHLLLQQKVEISVDVLEASNTIPAPDAASSDINKVVRSSYNDPYYTRLASRAIKSWKEEFDNVYHESGVLVVGDSPYSRAALDNDIWVANARIKDRAQVENSLLPSSLPLDRSYYLNLDGGWANASKGVAQMIGKAKNLGARFHAGKQVVQVVYGEDHKAIGVRLADGSVMNADSIVLATGAWTPVLDENDPSLGAAKHLVASGQCIATIKTEDASLYRSIPVVLDLDTGFYSFPPNEDGLMKIAIHGEGYSWFEASAISQPRTSRSHGEVDGSRIPKRAEQELRKELSKFFPELSTAPFSSTRICWYTDTLDEDWLIDEHPNHPNLYFATGGSGHAYKFLPVIGELVVRRMLGELEPELQSKFAWTRTVEAHHGFRIGRTRSLREDLSQE